METLCWSRIRREGWVELLWNSRVSHNDPNMLPELSWFRLTRLLHRGSKMIPRLGWKVGHAAWFLPLPNNWTFVSTETLFLIKFQLNHNCCCSLCDWKDSLESFSRESFISWLRDPGRPPASETPHQNLTWASNKETETLQAERQMDRWTERETERDRQRQTETDRQKRRKTTFLTLAKYGKRTCWFL